MAQADYNIANAPGAAVRADINGQLEAIASKNSSVNAPVPSFPWMWWMDESANTLRIRNSANSAWDVFATRDNTTNTWQFGVLFASQSEAEAGVENTKAMTALRVAQAVNARLGEVAGRIPLWENTRFSKAPIVVKTANYQLQSTDRGSIICAGADGLTFDARQSALGDGFVFGVTANARTRVFTLSDTTATGNFYDVGHENVETITYTGRSVHWFTALNGVWFEIASPSYNTMDFPLLSTPAASDLVAIVTPSTGVRSKSPVSSLKPTALSQLTNDVGYITGIPGASIGQVQLKTATWSGSVADGSGGGNSTQVVAAGGEWNFFPEWWTPGGPDSTVALVANSTSTPESVFRLSVSSNGQANMSGRYVTASPPYDLGDGETDAFIFLVVDRSSGFVESTWFAQDPPWAYNGPTKTRADVFVDAKGNEFDMISALAGQKAIVPMIRYRKTTQTFEEAKANGPKALAKHLDEMLNGDVRYKPVTMQMKMADMPLIPHPFLDVPAEKKVVIVDPLSPMARKLMRLHHSGDKEAHPSLLFTRGDMRLHNDDLCKTKNRRGPPGVPMISVNVR